MKIVRTAALLVAMLGMLTLGLWIGGHPAKMPPPLRDIFIDDAVGLTAEASELIEDNYFRVVTGEELSDFSLRGMAKGLRTRFDDRFTEYLPPALLKRFNEAIEGEFSGIGLSVGQVKQGLLVGKVFKDSPAEEAGIEKGDIVISVEGDSIAGVNSVVATERIKGPEGTTVRIGVRDGVTGKVRQVELVRAKIAVPAVMGRIVESADGKKLGYAQIATFSHGVHAALHNVVARLQKKGAEGLILDMRSNGGGLLQEAVLSASVFLPKDTLVVTTKSRTQGDATYVALGGNLPAMPIAILIDGNTASAAEILTAALAEQADATVIGSKSYGKGVFQQEVGLHNGGAMKLTIGEYYTPNGENLGGNGIEPDIAVEDRPHSGADEVYERALSVLAKQRDPS